MIRSRLTLAFVLAAATIATAQMKPVQIQKSPNQPSAQVQAAAQIDEVGLLRKDVLRMRTELQDLKNQIAALRQSQPDMPKCSDDTTSTSKLGSRDCGAFRCDRSTGSCISSCNSSNDCGAGAACDMGNGRCVVVR